MSQKTSVKSSKTGTQMPLINVDASQAPSVNAAPTKAPKASKVPKASSTSATRSASPAVVKAAKPKAAKPKAPKTEQKTQSERPLFKPGQRIFYLREPVVKSPDDDNEQKNVRQKGRPFGCVAYEFVKLDEKTYSFQCGLSLVNKKFDDWDRTKARDIAVGRCSLNPTIFFKFTEKEAKAILQDLKSKYVATSNFEVLFTLEEISNVHSMKRVVRAIKATLNDYSLDNAKALDSASRRG